MSVVPSHDKMPDMEDRITITFRSELTVEKKETPDLAGLGFEAFSSWSTTPPGPFNGNKCSTGEQNDDSSTTNHDTKSSKLDCPRFDDYGFEGWVLKLDQYLEAESMSEVSKVHTVKLHLEGKALQWHHPYVKLWRNSDGPVENLSARDEGRFTN